MQTLSVGILKRVVYYFKTLSVVVVMCLFVSGCGKNKGSLYVDDLASVIDSTNENSNNNNKSKSKYDPNLYSPNELFSCNNNADPAPSRNRRLSRYEYLNSLEQIFGQYLMKAMNLKKDVLVYENSYLNFDNTELEVSTDLIDGYFEFALEIANKLEASSSYRNTIKANCFYEATVTTTCVNNFISWFGKKVYRRPLTDTEKTDNFNFYKSFNNPKQGFRALIVTFLNSPDFLYKLEIKGNEVNGNPDLLKLTSYELATKLSYLFWGLAPDETLMQAADSGSLMTEAGFKEQLERLLSNSRAKQHIKNFYKQWLNIYGDFTDNYSLAFLKGIQFKKYRSFAPEEVEWFVDYILWEKKGNMVDLLLDRTALVKDNQLAIIYGSDHVVSSLTPQQLPPNERSGILTRAFMLANGEDDTHPFRRGSTVMSRYMCQTPPRPDEEGLPEGALLEPVNDGSLSTRHRFEVKTNSPVCMTCHQILNPLSFALESYDSLGRYRTIEKVFIDGTLVSDHLPINTVVDYQFDEQKATVNGAVELSQKLSENPRTHQCAVRQWYRFSHGQAESPADACVLDKMYKVLVKENGSFYEMFKETALQSSFGLKKVGKR